MFLGAPESYGVEYGYREDIGFTVNITGTKAAAAQVLQALAVEQLRRENWLMLQLQAGTAPMWFHTWRREPGDLSLEFVYDESSSEPIPDLWQVTVPLTADSFIYGARETLPAVTINNDPAAGSNPCFYKLPAIKGDAPAPLRIVADFSASLDQADIVLATAPVPDSYTAPIVWPIGTSDGLTAGTDTAAASTNSAYSGGSYRSCSFATDATMETRLTGVAPAAIPAGRYNVYLRVARSDTDTTFAFRFGYDAFGGVDVAGSPTVVMDRVASTSAGHATWVPLGTFSFPKNANGLHDLGYQYPPQWALQAQRLSGTGAARFDSIILIPVDIEEVGDAGRVLISSFDAFGPQGTDVGAYWDGDIEAFTRVNLYAIGDTSIQPSALRGGFPLVYPGETTVLHVLQQTRTASGYFGATDNTDVITRTASVTLSYHPRYLYLRGD